MTKLFLALLIFVVGFVLMIMISMRIYKKYDEVNKKIHPSKEQIWEGQNGKALMLFQPSCHNTTEEMVDVVGNDLSARLGYRVVKNHVTCTETYDLEEIDVLVFATPIYMEKCSPNIEQYLREHPFRGKKVLLVATGIHTETMEELEQLSHLLDRDNEIHIVKVSKGEKKKLRRFVEDKIGE